MGVGADVKCFIGTASQERGRYANRRSRAHNHGPNDQRHTDDAEGGGGASLFLSGLVFMVISFLMFLENLKLRRCGSEAF